MASFGVKRFKRKEQQALEEALSKSPQCYLPCAVPLKNKAQSTDYSPSVAVANKIFGFNGWSYSITEQSIDFIDFKDEKFEVGVSSAVKVVLRDGSYREDLGYGLSKGLKCKGASIFKARKMAVHEALKNSLSAFGDAFCFNSQTGPQITDNFISSQQPMSRPHSILGGVKRKLNEEFERVAAESRTSAAAVPESIASTSHQAVPVSDAVSDLNLDIVPKTEIQENMDCTSQSPSKKISSQGDLFCNPSQAVNDSQEAHCSTLRDVGDSKFSGSAESTSFVGYSSQKLTYSPNRATYRRKIESLRKEIECRQQRMKELEDMLMRENSISNGFSGECERVED